MASLSGSYALSGPLSRRSLGTQSGTLRRLARQIERDGGNPTQVLTAAGAAELAEPRIGSADSDIREQAYSLRANRGLAEGRRRSLLNPAPTPSAPAAAAASPAAPVQRTQSTVPPLLQRQAPVRQGLINGRPAQTVLGEMRDAAPSDTEPGNLQDTQRANLAGPPATGPLQRALNEAMARRAEREREETSDEIVMEPAPRVAPVSQSVPPATAAAPTLQRAAPRQPSTLGEAVASDFADLADAGSRRLDQAGRAIRGGAEAVGRGALRTRDAVIDAGVDVASRPASTLARFIPGRTGDLLSRRTEETKARARRLLRDTANRSPLTFTP